ncbi:hypothetical protein [Rhodoferax sp.]|uniref:hypothetical protein n=1 Tax=Rhodoferax sp. TaxID=50421 RepID=UPI00275B1B5F|nr:hypothetical protein [Rhodoferax sp.]
MNVKEMSKAWAVDQLDPDNWLEIPDFGIRPQDVVFEGFAFPLVSPIVRGYGLRRIIREQVKTARALIRKESLTLAEVKANYIQVLEMMMEGTHTAKIDATRAQTMSTFYMVSIGSADRASRYSFGNHNQVITERTRNACFEAIEQCAQGIRYLALQSTKAKTDVVSKEDEDRLRAAIRSVHSVAGTEGGKARSERYEPFKQWALQQAKSMQGSDKQIAGKLLASLPQNFAAISNDPERLIYDTLRASKKKPAI